MTISLNIVISLPSPPSFLALQVQKLYLAKIGTKEFTYKSKSLTNNTKNSKANGVLHIQLNIDKKLWRYM